jgi:hypothetical protein
MQFTVTWKPHAEDGLTRIWRAAKDRQAVSDSANEIDRRLRLDPETYGEPLFGQTRVVVVSPLAVHFDVHPQGRLVNVLTVRYLPPVQDE